MACTFCGIAAPHLATQRGLQPMTFTLRTHACFVAMLATVALLAGTDVTCTGHASAAESDLTVASSDAPPTETPAVAPQVEEVILDPSPYPRTPAEFTAAIATITSAWMGEPYTHASDVRRRLGTPDAVRTQEYPGGLDGSAFANELWCYGADSPLDFPVLGQVMIRTDGTVEWAMGGTGEPPAPDVLSEAERVELVRLIAEFPPCLWDRRWDRDRRDYDPTTVVRIVNRLREAGKEKALAAIGEFLRLTFEEQSAKDAGLLLPVLLFDVPADAPERPIEVFSGRHLRAEFPMYPLVLIDDLPIVLWPLAGGGGGGGLPSPLDALPYWREHGVLRTEALRPTGHPVAAADAFIVERLAAIPDERLIDPPGKVRVREEPGEGCRPDRDERDRARELVRRQMLTALGTVFRDTSDETCLPWQLQDTFIDERWEVCRAVLSNQPLRWSADLNRFEFANGAVLPPLERPGFVDGRAVRHAWRLPIADRAVLLVVTRQDRGRIAIDLSSDAPEEARPLDGLQLVVDGVTEDDGTVLSFDLGKCSPGGSCGSSRWCLLLAPGQPIVARFTLDGVTHEWRAAL